MHAIVAVPGRSSSSSSSLPASPDAVHQALRLLSPAMTARVIHQLQAGPSGKRDLLERIEECNPSTLYGRLDAMRDAGLIEISRGPGATWQLTQDGRAAVPVLRAVAEWARHRSHPGPATSAVLQVEAGLRLLAAAHTTRIITGLSHGPLTVKQLLPVLPDHVTQYNLRVRLGVLVREQVLSQDKAGPRLRFHLTVDGLHSAKVHHRAAAFALSRSGAVPAEARSGSPAPTLVFSHSHQRARAA